MSLENNYSVLLNMYLQKHKQLKIHVNKSGKVAKIEKEENGNWKTDRNLCNIINRYSNGFETDKNLVITLKQ
ncbi:hypothetical protein [Tenacibaculum sp. 190524A02b]|uniref:Uncharacterized protein n=1 Tax=Tenacibaculum vairaonense TaxID=3137860 RepID=A0ABP1F7L4_9FLAO